MLKKILHFPITKILIGFFIVGLSYGLSQFLMTELLGLTSVGGDFKKLITGIVSSIIAVFTYILLYKYYENRVVSEFSMTHIGRDLLTGVVLGFLLQSLTILVIYVLGGYTIEATNSFIYLVPALAMGLTSAIVEEILLRGIVFRIAEEKLGSYIALFISALLFGALHIGNPNSTLIASLGIAIQAGLLLGVAYMYTRNLWFPIGIHFAWNFAQSGIYGASVSGHQLDKSLFTSNIEGADLWTGGNFGPEGSIQATVFCLIAMLILFKLCKNKKGGIIKPYWKADA